MIRLEWMEEGGIDPSVQIPCSMMVDIYYTFDEQDQPRDTVLRLLGEDNTEIAVGQANLHHLDRFNKRTGRKVAFADALEQAGFDKPTRNKLWDAFLEKVKV